MNVMHVRNVNERQSREVGGVGEWGLVLLRIHFSHPAFIHDLYDYSHDPPATVEC